MIVALPILPHRQIEVFEAEAGQWQARFVGDAWTRPFRTERGSRRLVLDALRYHRQGLPIVDRGARRFPYPTGFSPRFAVDPFEPDFDPRSAA